MKNALGNYLATVCFMAAIISGVFVYGQTNQLVETNQTAVTNPQKVEKVFTPEIIKKNGHEDSNYLVMISASWCPGCKAMYPEMKELVKAGYIVYVFDVTKPEFKDFDKKYPSIKAYPTFLVIENGKVTHRTIGGTKHVWFTKRLKTNAEQETNKKRPAVPFTPYDGI